MPRLTLAPALALALLGLAACPKPPSTSGDGPSSDPATVPSGAIDPGSASAGGTPSTAPGCLRDADCDGGVCEGQGCGDDQPGTCMPRDRMCTRDSVVYCGCDGTSFRASGSCPGQRYAAKGECSTAPAPGTGAADGSTCLTAGECQSGVCEGQGCGDDQPGTCVPRSRMCTRDLQPYCGCDGTTFRTSGSCPGQRYSARGECSTAPGQG